MTPKQRARIPEFVWKWIAIGASPAVDRDEAERALCRLYACAELAEPHIVWAACPMSAMLSAIVYVAIRATGQEDIVRKDGALTALVERMIGGALIALMPASVHRPIRSAVERSVAAALRLPARGSGFARGVAIIEACRLGWLDSPLDRALYKTLRHHLFTPIHYGGRLSGPVEMPLDALGKALQGRETPQVQYAGFGSLLSLGHAGLLDFTELVLGVPLHRQFRDAVRCCRAFWVLDGMCFAAESPSYMNLDAAGHLHCEVGPAAAFPSGWGWWYWHGVQVPQKIIEEPGTITVAAIEAMRSARIRRVMIERYRHGHETHGAAAFLRDAGAVRLDHDPAFGTLWRREFADQEPILMVEVVDHSPDPDGSYKHYFLSVDPALRPILGDGSFGAPQEPTARNAVASTFGLPGAGYAPDVQT